MFAGAVFARSSTFKGDPTGIRDGISYVQDEAMKTLEEVEGFVGLSMMVDRGSGECITTTAWDTADAMRASSDRITGVRGRLGGLLMAPATVQEWEVAVMHRAEDTPRGAVVPGQLAAHQRTTMWTTGSTSIATSCCPASRSSRASAARA